MHAYVRAHVRIHKAQVIQRSICNTTPRTKLEKQYLLLSKALHTLFDMPKEECCTFVQDREQAVCVVEPAVLRAWSTSKWKEVRNRMSATLGGSQLMRSAN
jgi:hypothetical protein